MKATVKRMRDGGAKRAAGVVARCVRTMCEGLEGRRLLAAGDLDPSFGGDGFVDVPHPVEDIEIRADGRIITAGPGHLMSRLANGSVDTSFGGGDGIAGSPITIRDMALAPDGKIVAVGHTQSNHFAVARFNADGSFDTSFSGTGLRIIPMTSRTTASDGSTAGSVVVRGDRKIVAVGSVTYAPFDDRSVVVRVNADGSLDGSFSGDGIGLFDFGSSEGAHAVALQADGKMAVGGARQTGQARAEAWVFRVDKFGNLDQGFGAGGIRTVAESLATNVNDLAIVSDGRILFAGGGGYIPLLGRLTANGNIDSSFGQNGYVNVPGFEFGNWNDVDVQSDGKVLVAGPMEGGGADSGAVVVRLLSNGAVDPSFGQQGVARLRHAFHNQSSAMALQADGRIVVGVISMPDPSLPSTPQHALARLLGDTPQPPQGQEPFIGRPWTINENIEAESFDRGGQGVAYHDQEPQNIGGVYRPNEGVDIHANSDSGVSGFNVGWVNNGEWLEYTVNVPQGGTYVLDARVATPKTGANIAFSLGGMALTQVDVPNTGSFATWRTITSGNVTLPAGTHVLRVTFNGPSNIGGLTNLNWLRIRPAQGPAQGARRDPTFGDNGLVRDVLHPLDVHVVLPDGRFYTGGQTSVGEGIITRYLPNGQVDTSFGRDGDLVTGVKFKALAVAPNGRIVIGTEDNQGNIGIHAYTPDGRIDNTFGGSGFRIFDPSDNNFQTASHNKFADLLVRSDGKIVAVGFASRANGTGEPIVMRINPDGSLDGSFRGGLVRLSGVGDATSVALQSTGKIIVGGDSLIGTEIRATLTRLNKDGSLDTTFGNGGSAIFDLGQSTRMVDLEVHPLDIVYFAGNTLGNDGLHHGFLGRVTADGRTNYTFANGSSFIVDSAPDSSWEDIDLDVDLSPSDGIYLSGTRARSINEFDKVAVLMRLDEDTGAADTVFAPNGRFETPFGEQDSVWGRLMALQGEDILQSGIHGFYIPEMDTFRQTHFLQRITGD